MSENARRPVAVITGANGGMGRACARLLGATRDLVLTDASDALDAFAAELAAEGFTVRGHVVGDLGAPDILDRIAALTDESLDVLIHTAGIGPSGPWRKVMDVNYVATVKLLDRVTPMLHHGSAAVLIASVAGHLLPPNPKAQAVLASPLSASLCNDLEPVLKELAGDAGESDYGTFSYFLSKQKVLDLCQDRAAEWGQVGARIVSISPGMIFTPMGRHEVDVDPRSEQALKGAPLGRWGTPMEIAMAANFLVSPEASFITGSDIKVDGGGLSLVKAHARKEMLDARG